MSLTNFEITADDEYGEITAHMHCTICYSETHAGATLEDLLIAAAAHLNTECAEPL